MSKALPSSFLSTSLLRLGCSELMRIAGSAIAPWKSCREKCPSSHRMDGTRNQSSIHSEIHSYYQFSQWVVRADWGFRIPPSMLHMNGPRAIHMVLGRRNHFAGSQVGI
eukprot:scaffold4518_cov149-Cylindrotheca_fusiformis.AAC.2